LCEKKKKRKSPRKKLRETIGSFYDLWRFAAAMSFVPYGGVPPLLSPGRANPPTLGRWAAFWTGSGREIRFISSADLFFPALLESSDNFSASFSMLIRLAMRLAADSDDVEDAGRDLPTLAVTGDSGRRSLEL